LIESATKERWDRAQEYEKQWWIKNKPQTFDYTIPAAFAGYKIQQFGNYNNSTKILQIGCGPIDLINFLNLGKKYAIDPLINYYRERGLILENNDINYYNVRAEEMEFKDNFFDVIICNNTIDHMQNPKKAINNMEKKLKKNGILLSSTYVIRENLYPLIKFISKTEINTFKGHPHLFTEKTLMDFHKKKFEVLESFPINYSFTLNELFSSKIIKAIFEYSFLIIAKKR